MGSCCSNSKKISAAELEAQEKAAREAAERLRREEDERRLMEEDTERKRLETIRIRLETVRANYQQGIDALLLNEREFGSIQSKEMQVTLGVVPGTLSSQFQDQKDRSGTQYFDYLGVHWNKFESYRFNGWQAGLSHLTFEDKVTRKLKVVTMPPLSAWVRGLPLPGGPLLDFKAVLKGGGFTSDEMDILLGGVVHFEKDVASGASGRKKIDFRERVGLSSRGAAPIAPETNYGDRGSVETKTEEVQGAEEGSRSGKSVKSAGPEPLGHGWGYRGRPTSPSRDKRRGDSFFALCSERWHLIRREPVPGGVLGRWFAPVSSVGPPSPSPLPSPIRWKEEAEERTSRDLTDEVFRASLRPGLYERADEGVYEEEEEQAGAGAVASSAECEAWYLRNSPELSLDLMPRRLSPPMNGSNNRGKGGRQYLHQRQYDYVPYVPPPSLSFAYDLHLRPIEATLELQPRAGEEEVHRRLRGLVHRIYRHSHRIPLPGRASGPGGSQGGRAGSTGGRNRKRFMLRREKATQRYANSAARDEQAKMHEVDPYFDPRFPESDVRVTFRGRKRQESEDMCNTLAHLQLFLKAQEHSERELHLLVAREEGERRVRVEAEAGLEEDLDQETPLDAVGEGGTDGASSASSRQGQGARAKAQAQAQAQAQAHRRGRRVGKAGSQSSRRTASPSPSRASLKAGGYGAGSGSGSAGASGKSISASGQAISTRKRKDSKGGDSVGSKGAGVAVVHHDSPASSPESLTLPQPMSFREWTQGLLPSSLGVTQFGRHSLWDALSELLTDLRHNVDSGGGGYSPQGAPTGGNLTPAPHPLSQGLVFSHPSLFPSVPAPAIPEATTAHLLYPTDGKRHKFSRKQQAKGHYAVSGHTAHTPGKLPVDLYITPREIEEDTVGSSFEDSEATIATEPEAEAEAEAEAEGHRLAELKEEEDGTYGDGAPWQPENQGGEPGGAAGVSSLPPLGVVCAGKDSTVTGSADLDASAIPELSHALPSAYEDRLRRVYRRKISYVLTREARGRPDVYSCDDGAATAGQGTGTGTGTGTATGGMSLRKTSATLQQLREDLPEKGGVRGAYIRARQHFSRFLRAHRRNLHLMECLDRLSTASYGEHTEQARLMSATAALQEATETASAVRAGVRAGRQAAPTPRNGAAFAGEGQGVDLEPPPLAAAVSPMGGGQGRGELRPLDGKEEVGEEEDEALSAALMVVREREAAVRDLAKTVAYLRQVVAKDSGTVVTLSMHPVRGETWGDNQPPGEVMSATAGWSGGQRRPFDVGRFLSLSRGVLSAEAQRQHHHALCLAPGLTAHGTSVMDNAEGSQGDAERVVTPASSHGLRVSQAYLQGSRHTDILLRLFGRLRSMVERQCVALANQVRERARHLASEGLVRDTHAATHCRRELSAEHVPTLGGVKSAETDADAVAKAKAKAKAKTRVKISARSLSLKRRLLGNGNKTGADSLGAESGAGSSLSRRRRDVRSVLYPLDTDPSLVVTRSDGDGGEEEGGTQEWRAHLPCYLSQHHVPERSHFRRLKGSSKALAEAETSRLIRGLVYSLMEGVPVTESTGNTGGDTTAVPGPCKLQPPALPALPYRATEACWQPVMGFTAAMPPPPPHSLSLPASYTRAVLNYPPRAQSREQGQGLGMAGESLPGLQQLLLLVFCDPLLSRALAASELLNVRHRAVAPEEEGETVHFRLSLSLSLDAGKGEGEGKGNGEGEGEGEGEDRSPLNSDRAYARTVSGSVSVFYKGCSAKEPLHVPLGLARGLNEALRDLERCRQRCIAIAGGASEGDQAPGTARVVLGF